MRAIDATLTPIIINRLIGGGVGSIMITYYRIETKELDCLVNLLIPC